MFSALVERVWPSATSSAQADSVHIVVDPALKATRSVSLLSRADGIRTARLTPDRASELSLTDGDAVAADDLTSRLEAAGLELNGADHVYFLPLAEQDAVRAEAPAAGIRELTADDAELWARFVEKAPEDDLDDAYVELDHWLVFGAIVDGRLVAAASMYPWDDSTLADLGVITLPEVRGQGFARATVRALSAEALRRGYEPQYRCQLDNAASIALAESAGFALYGDWDVVATD
jgi:RimJ/RimL family protein N-acetyltransferase